MYQNQYESLVEKIASEIIDSAMYKEAEEGTIKSKLRAAKERASDFVNQNPNAPYIAGAGALGLAGGGYGLSKLLKNRKIGKAQAAIIQSRLAGGARDAARSSADAMHSFNSSPEKDRQLAKIQAEIKSRRGANEAAMASADAMHDYNRSISPQVEAIKEMVESAPAKKQGKIKGAMNYIKNMVGMKRAAAEALEDGISKMAAAEEVYENGMAEIDAATAILEELGIDVSELLGDGYYE